MLLTFLKGLLMGVADIIPGVSGGTMAFITGIYDRFILALSNLSTAGRHLLSGEPKKAWSFVDWNFLFPLALGIACAFALGSFIVPGLLDNYPTYVFSFFVGLILVSAWIVYTHIRVHNVLTSVLLVLGVVLGYLVASSRVFHTFSSTPFIFLMGIISVSAMLLPGISGSYVLLIFGQYQYILESLRHLDWNVLIAYKLGAITGLLVFSKVLSWLLKRFHSETFATLTGIMIGALYGPTSQAVGFATPEMVFPAIIFLLLGMVAVIVVERLAKHKRNA